jgi:glutamate-ammonia-ligase adenylyltransferase
MLRTMPTAWQRRICADFGEDAAHVCALADEIAPDLPDPAQGLADLADFVDANGEVATALRQLRADPLALDLLMRLGGISRYAFVIARLHPGFFWDILQGRAFRQVWGRRTLADALNGLLATLTTPTARLHAIQWFKARHWLRITLGDLSGDLRLPAIISELADITDVVVQACLDEALAKIGGRFGPALPPTHPDAPGLVVLGMGKLGGRELNYSSDIDLILIYEHHGDAVGDLDAHEWYRRTGAELIRLLEEPGETGPMYRVDMRLRPEGERGELVLSRRETVDYYWSVGRPWERQAMIKARPIAGSLALGSRLMADLTTWVYPQSPAWEDLEESRSMRRRIEERAESANIKTGAGGIRDIEFLVQYFQLAFAGRDPELRRRDTLPTLRLLADRGTLPRADAEVLARHYSWLRTIEHRLQMWENRQEHDIPGDAAARTHLARRSGYAGASALATFDLHHAQARAEVRSVVARHFLEGSRDSDGILALLVSGEADPALATRVLAGVGFTDPGRAAANVRALAVEPFFVLSRSRTERALAALLPLLLHLLQHSPDPDQTLENLLRIVSAVGGRATFLEMLGTRPLALNLIVDFCGWSSFLVQLCVETPGLTDEIMDLLARRAPPPTALFAEALQLTQGITAPAEPLAHLLGRETAAIAIKDIEGLSQDAVGARMSAVAEPLLQVLLARTVGARSRTWGMPLDKGRPTRFAVLGLGKLGGAELSYASDIDIVYVCDAGGACPRTDKDGPEFWTRIAQDLGRSSQEGRLFDLDPRLRPWGEQGELVITADAFARYWSEPRDLWERLAMVRARPVAGDLYFATEQAAVLRAAAVAAPVPADGAAQVRAMRRRLEDSVVGRDHLKRGWGGYVDPEFIAQFLSLGLPAEALPTPGGTGPSLRRLAELGRIPPAAAEDLCAGLAVLRFVESRMRLVVGKAISSIPTEPGPRDSLAKRCRFTSFQALDERLHHARERNRFWFDRLI